MIDSGYSDVVGNHCTDVGPGGLSIGQEPLIMAYCEQHLAYMQVNYTLTFHGEVLHRVGLEEQNTGAVTSDHWQSTFVIAPPARRHGGAC